MGGVGIFFLVRNAKEEPVPFPRFIGRLINRIKKQMLKKS